MVAGSLGRETHIREKNHKDFGDYSGSCLSLPNTSLHSEGRKKIRLLRLCLFRVVNAQETLVELNQWFSTGDSFIPQGAFMESKKYNKLVNIIKKQTHRYREQSSRYQWGGEEGQHRGRRLRGTNYGYYV